MAPKKAADLAKGKALLEMDEPASMKQSGSLKPALVGYHIGTEAQLEKVRYVAASATNGWGRQSQYDASAAVAFVLAP